MCMNFTVHVWNTSLHAYGNRTSPTMYGQVLLEICMQRLAARWLNWPMPCLDKLHAKIVTNLHCSFPCLHFS